MDSSNSSFTTNNNSFNNGLGAPLRHSSSSDDQSRMHALGINLFGANMGMSLFNHTSSTNNLNHNVSDERDGADEISEHSCFSEQEEAYNENNQNSYENHEEDRDSDDGEEIRNENRLKKTNQIENDLTNHETYSQDKSHKKRGSLSDTELVKESEKKVKLKHSLDTGSNSNF